MACLVYFYNAGYHFQLASFLSKLTGFQLATCAHQLSTLKLYRHTSVTIIKFILNSIISLLWQPTCTRCISVLKCEHGCMTKENYEAPQSQHWNNDNDNNVMRLKCLAVYFNVKTHDIGEVNVTMRSEILIEDICSPRFRNMREGVTKERVTQGWYYGV